MFAVRQFRRTVNFSVSFAVRDDKKRTAKSFTVQFSAVCSLPCVFEKNARQNLCRAFYRICRAPQTHSNPSYSRSARR
jgi:hypothetical protein